jgi:hypothetical protein
MARDLPTDWSFEALFGPQRDHPYFEGAADRPFRPHAFDFDPVNAWWCAEASLLTYVPEEEFVREALEAAGLRMTYRFDAGPRGFLAEGPDFSILAFRGTVFPDPHDLLADIDVRQTDFPGGGQVHQGFYDSIRMVRPRLGRRVDRATAPVWATGHSLGAALATLAGALLTPVRKVLTFGGPRIGDRAFGEHYPAPLWRVVNGSDFVARIPPAGPFRHLGELVYIDSTGRYRRDSKRWERVIDGVLGQIDLGTEAVDAIVDHAALCYAIHAENALSAQ